MKDFFQFHGGLTGG